MAEEAPPLIINDVTLREYGQNVSARYLDIFTPQKRAEVALGLIRAGFSGIEVLSCINPGIAPAMNREDLQRTADLIGKVGKTRIITLVPNRRGYDTFLSLGLGPEGYNHTMGIFFSAVESHNLANLGRTIKETLEGYKQILKDAVSRGIRTVAYISAAFGYREPKTSKTVSPRIDDLNDFINLLFDLHVGAVTLSDLQGIADEKETARIISGILDKKEGVGANLLGYHPHNLSGDKAIANSSVVYHLGIRRFDSSLGGTGGCITGAPGNQPTEDLIRYFHNLGVNTDIDQALVDSLSETVRSEFYSRIILDSQP